MTPEFKPGDVVQTKKGAAFCGVVVSVYDLSVWVPDIAGNTWRADVVATDPRFYGTIHVYPILQLELAP